MRNHGVPLQYVPERGDNTSVVAEAFQREVDIAQCAETGHVTCIETLSVIICGNFAGAWLEGTWLEPWSSCRSTMKRVLRGEAAKPRQWSQAYLRSG